MRNPYPDLVFFIFSDRGVGYPAFRNPLDAEKIPGRSEIPDIYPVVLIRLPAHVNQVGAHLDRSFRNLA